VLFFATLSACTPNQQPDTLTLGSPFEFNSQDPAKDGEIFAKLQIGETLLDVNAQGQLHAGLAEMWSIDSTLLIWRFTLRPGVRFHDGSELTAQAVLNSLQRAHAKPGVFKNVPLRAMSAPDNNSVVIELSEPYNLLGAVLAHFTTQILAPAAYNANGDVTHFLGTGPYHITAIDPPHQIKAERFAQYWGEPARIAKLFFLTGARAESRSLQALSGQTDIIYTLDPASLALLRRHAEVRVDSQAIPRTIQIKLNSGHRFLNDKRARHALSLALDRTGLAESIFRVPGAEANQLVPAMLSDWHLPNLAPLTQNLSHAEALLAELGWQRGADQLLHRGNDTFALSLITYGDRPELLTIATAIQSQWRALGVDLRISVENSSSIPLGHVNNSLEVALVARNYAVISDPLGIFLSDFAGTGGGEWGAMNWDNSTLLPLFTQLKRETNRDAYHQTAQQIASLLADEMPVIPVLFYTQQSAVSARVGNFSFDPFERSYHVAEMTLP
jgi:peptide/nickel transport system substrate-binding protein